MNNNNLLLVSGAALIMLLSACQQKDDGESKREPAAPPQATAPAPVVPPTPFDSSFVLVDKQAFQSDKRAACAIDKANQLPATQIVSVATSEKLELAGWVATASKQVPDEFQIVLQSVDNVYAAKAKAGYPRADVAKALQSDDLKLAGFDVFGDLASVAPGEYTVSVAHLEAGNVFICPDRARITVIAP